MLKPFLAFGNHRSQMCNISFGLRGYPFQASLGEVSPITSDALAIPSSLDRKSGDMSIVRYDSPVVGLADMAEIEELGIDLANLVAAVATSARRPKQQIAHPIRLN